MYGLSLEILVLLVIFAFGAIIGSFINVVILRHGTGRSIAKGSSACFSCARKLSWYELVPIFSYAALRGKCRTCRSAVSLQYPLVELAVGVAFLMLAIRGGLTFLTLILGLTFATLAAIFVYDLRHKIIPDSFSLAFALLALVPAGLMVYEYSLPIFSSGVLLWLAAGPLLALPFFLIWLVSRGRWMGLGDAKLAWGMGWLLGLSYGFAAVILAFWIGAGVSLLMLAVQSLSGKGKGLTMKSEVPFGPYLIIALVIVFFCGIDMSVLLGWFAF